MQLTLLTTAAMVAGFSIVTQQTPLDTTTTTDISPAEAVITPAPSALSVFPSGLERNVVQTLPSNPANYPLQPAVHSNPVHEALFTSLFNSLEILTYNPSGAHAPTTAQPTELRSILCSIASKDSTINAQDSETKPTSIDASAPATLKARQASTPQRPSTSDTTAIPIPASSTWFPPYSSNPIPVPDPATAEAAFSSDLASFVTKGLASNSAFSALLSAIQTSPAQKSLVAAAFGAINPPAYNPAALESLVAAVPSQFAPLVMSIAGVESSLARKDGVLASVGGGAAQTSSASAGASLAAGGSVSGITLSVGVAAASASASASPGAATASSGGKPTGSKASGASSLDLEMGVVAGVLMGMIGLVVIL